MPLQILLQVWSVLDPSSCQQEVDLLQQMSILRTRPLQAQNSISHRLTSLHIHPWSIRTSWGRESTYLLPLIKDICKSSTARIPNSVTTSTWKDIVPTVQDASLTTPKIWINYNLRPLGTKHGHPLAGHHFVKIQTVVSVIFALEGISVKPAIANLLLKCTIRMSVHCISMMLAPVKKSRCTYLTSCRSKEDMSGNHLARDRQRQHQFQKQHLSSPDLAMADLPHPLIPTRMLCDLLLPSLLHWESQIQASAALLGDGDPLLCH